LGKNVPQKIGRGEEKIGMEELRKGGIGKGGRETSKKRAGGQPGKDAS